MAQLIQYLYEYENGKRIRNLGFMKVEKQMDKSVIQLYAKQVDVVKGILFEREDGSKYMAAWEACEEEMTTQRDRTSRGKVVTPCDDAVPCEDAERTKEMKEMDEPAPYIAPTNVRCKKIQRQELSRLPRQEWKLANNSFLLHGFYNYHHLLYIEEDNMVWIGVPGIYHEKEEIAAKAFGFPEFRRMNDLNVDLKPEETNTYEDFGYWCRQVSRSSV